MAEEATVLVDGEHIYATQDGDGILVTYSDKCPVQELSTILVLAANAGLDMNDQWWDTQEERHVLTFGNKEIE